MAFGATRRHLLGPGEFPLTLETPRPPTHPTRPRSQGQRVAWLMCAGAGFAPIGTLALSLLEIVPMHRSAPVLLGLAAVAGLTTTSLSPELRRPVVRGLGIGLLAVTIYDITRMPFVILGGWPDFIPKIGAWLFDRPRAHWSIGYLWRYVGNGAGMGLGFAMLAPMVTPQLSRRTAGILFGLLIWCGLIATLLIAPDGQEKLFRLTPATIALSLLGHIVYGGVLGRFAE